MHCVYPSMCSSRGDLARPRHPAAPSHGSGVIVSVLRGRGDGVMRAGFCWKVGALELTTAYSWNCSADLLSSARSRSAWLGMSLPFDSPSQLWALALFFAA